jgi:hypothetical protein
MPKVLLDHTLIEVSRHRADARKPAQKITKQVEGSPRALATEPDLDESRRVKLDVRPVRSIPQMSEKPASVQILFCNHHPLREEVEARRKIFIRKWRLKHHAVADSLEEAGERLFTFTRLPPSQWRSARTTNAIERLHEEFKRRIKTQTVLPSADTAAMLFWALLASGQISMRKVDGWQTLATKPIDPTIDLAA